MPRIGLIPSFLHSLKNSTTPNMHPWSVIAKLSMPSDLARRTSSGILLAPSSRL